MALRLRGETVEEITGAAQVLRARMTAMTAPPEAIDVIGTGGDGSNSYNISTCAALVAAGAGALIAKQGNRAMSSRSGAADVLAALGVRLDLAPSDVERCIAEVGIGFIFAQNHHPALRTVVTSRHEMGTRTVFNLLGPLVNAANVRRHLIGVYDPRLPSIVAKVLARLGSERAYVVHGSDGLDEITLTGPTRVAELRDGAVSEFEIVPEMFGFERSAPDALRGGDAQINAAALSDVLDGVPGAYRDVTILNAGVALVVAGLAGDFAQGVRLAAKAIDSGAARDRLARLVAVSNAPGTTSWGGA